MSCNHTHSTVAAQFACDMVQAIKSRTGHACIVVIDEGAPGRPDVSDPAVSLIGNATGIANMVAAILDCVDDLPRPTDCQACAANYDRLRNAALVMRDRVGSC